MHRAIQGDRNMFLKANWEAKSDNIIKKHIVRNRIQDMKKRQHSDLAARKIKLAQLLAMEDKVYEKEFQDNLETPEQVRAKMAERLDVLKAQREQERKDLV